ncbi:MULTISPECIES: hypothetical protein [Derxia]|uniref:DUF697 domain-containing protein n=1 Tax=Derxia gummosa DSM 723 TaxID=1121388 RepID=A0A9U5CWP3_9BURK|nr:MULTISPECIES: hypothetical protein [Derxia]
MAANAQATNHTEATDWVLLDGAPDAAERGLPRSLDEIELITERCRRMVTRRALVSSAAAIVPLPGLDVLVDISMLMKLFDEINAEFGLSAEQVERLAPHRRVVAYQIALAAGSAVVGKVVTRELVVAVLKRLGVQITVKQAARYVPVAGQAVLAAISFAALRQVGRAHIRDCARVAGQMIAG